MPAPAPLGWRCLQQAGNAEIGRVTAGAAQCPRRGGQQFGGSNQIGSWAGQLPNRFDAALVARCRPPAPLCSRAPPQPVQRPAALPCCDASALSARSRGCAPACRSCCPACRAASGHWRAPGALCDARWPFKHPCLQPPTDTVSQGSRAGSDWQLECSASWGMLPPAQRHRQPLATGSRARCAPSAQPMVRPESPCWCK